MGEFLDYELYHDETKEHGYWHGMLLVPTDQKTCFINLLEKAREITDYRDPLGIKRIDRRNRIFHCAQAWVSIGFAALRSKTKEQPCPIYFGKWGVHDIYPQCSHFKFIVFREPNNFQNLRKFPDYGSKVETTFRFGIKGGVHALGEEENPINIVRLHFDGYEHYKRHLDNDRIIGRLSGLRDYFTISDSIDDRSSDHRKPDSQDYIDCQLLRLTDLLIGCFRTALGHGTRPLHSELALPMRDYLNKLKYGYKRMQNSRWFKSIWMSQCTLVDDRWKFTSLEIEQDEQYTQLDILPPFYD